MTVSTAMAALRFLLQIAAYFAKRAERADIEKAILNEIENTHRRRIDAAVDARNDVNSGRVPEPADDKYRRD